MIKVLAIMGSPRRGKNNDTLLDCILKGLSAPDVSIEKHYADELNVNPCKACAGCERKIGCVLEDDMQVLYEKFNTADIIILASPLYFNSISAQLKAVIDRCQAIWSSKYILNQSIINKSKKRIGYFICTAGAPENADLFNAAIPVIDMFFKSVNAEYLGNLLIADVDKHPAYQSKELLERAYHIGIGLREKIDKQ